MKEFLLYYLISGISTAIYIIQNHKELLELTKAIVNEEMIVLFTKKVFAVAAFIIGPVLFPFILLIETINMITYIITGK